MRTPLAIVADAVEDVVERVYRELEAKVERAEGDGLAARWAFGREMLKECGPTGRMPHGRLDVIAKATGKSRTELKYRLQFARQFPELAKALASCQSWNDFVNGSPDNHRAKGTGENEWYTPAEYIEAARRVLGKIDLDPASSDEAQKVIRAKRYFTKEQDGLSQPWRGRVWLNPPYSQPAIQRFIEKAVSEHAAGRVSEMIVLTHNYTDTKWGQLAIRSASGIVFTEGRIGFLSPEGKARGADARAGVLLLRHELRRLLARVCGLWRDCEAGLMSGRWGDLRNERAKHWNWNPLEGCFGETIAPSDIDFVVERNGRFLVFETKRPGEKLPVGQRLMLQALAAVKERFTVFVLTGEREQPQALQRVRWSGLDESVDCDWDYLRWLCRRWYEHVNGKRAA